MKYPTNRVLLRWWDQQPDGQYTCRDCGRVDSRAYVQPQHPAFNDGMEGIARCGACIGERNRQASLERKAQLDALPRCELCTRRGQWRVGSDGVLLCGAHKTAADRGVAGLGSFGLFAATSSSRDVVLSLARKGA